MTMNLRGIDNLYVVDATGIRGVPVAPIDGELLSRIGSGRLGHRLELNRPEATGRNSLGATR